ncbi:DNA/RNA non-specific endonuclease [Ferrovum myxofaciens]|uniref:Endonuclease n=1 Tax=Ferrovum myxofaciens TaxID=416213 RepID=A0A9E6SXR0_9PROT|nr:DNA/RNA non-specific endonuclease [Ferrovum myxofaciens]QKE37315.1 MAG: DNA/RNA non-specific endonuclease [Ferrovum myxofaciens]QWY74960.1 MAG: DNA/RNA non-specific endonuclease [Ferrovum myxofaciens]QWY77708.1 MAG: DNA/RNA non-specific endonuclease [Ferrovum myxofaciens]
MQNNRFKQTLLFMAMLSVAGIALAGSACPDQYPGGVVPVITRPAAWNAGMIELCAPHGGFADGYSPALRVPLYAVEHLTREHVVEHQRNHAGRHDSFRPDDRLSHNQRAELSDFKKSGFDRGHMAPDADSWDEESEYDTFVLSNMVPQAPDNNRELHAHIEGAVRHMAKQEGEIYVFTGPIFHGNTEYLNRRVAVPSGIFKLVYDPKRNAAAAYLENNVNGPDGQIYKTISVEELAKLTGIDFLPGKSPSLLSLPVPKESNHFGHTNSRHRFF